MKLTIKIAAGVFLGFMAAVAVLNLPKWTEANRSYHTRQLFEGLQPDEVTRRCGTPLHDATSGPSADMSDIPANRLMFYKGASGVYFAIVFRDFPKGHWIFTGVQQALPNFYTSDSGELHNYDSMLWALPCLKNAR